MAVVGSTGCGLRGAAADGGGGGGSQSASDEGRSRGKSPRRVAIRGSMSGWESAAPSALLWARAPGVVE